MELEATFAEQERVARGTTADMQSSIDAVLLEEGLAAVTRMVEAYAVLGNAAAADGIKDALFKRGAAAEGGKISAAINFVRRPEPRNETDKYLALADKLCTDANATVEARS